ncbi:hypothetical protein VP01_995g7 [Puccinia sorghi]|uniref:Uncharacterized protein n=1 Tax=Puccinia sorghi TaxID=27349 RepID=A0A0L6U5A9_9BASI|nr:hypothetical protein VP01_995g7 [Puccinia sorghi]
MASAEALRSADSSYDNRNEASSTPKDQQLVSATLWHRLIHAKNSLRIHVFIPLEAIVKDAFRNYPTLTTRWSFPFILNNLNIRYTNHAKQKKSYMMVLAGLSVIPIVAFVGFSLFLMSYFFMLCEVFVLMISLAFLVAAAFWIVMGLFLAIFVLRLVYNVQTTFVEKVRHSQVIKDLVNHVHEKRRQHHQNSLGRTSKSP